MDRVFVSYAREDAAGTIARAMNRSAPASAQADPRAMFVSRPPQLPLTVPKFSLLVNLDSCVFCQFSHYIWRSGWGRSQLIVVGAEDTYLQRWAVVRAVDIGDRRKSAPSGRENWGRFGAMAPSRTLQEQVVE